jgi:hypothetical protein
MFKLKDKLQNLEPAQEGSIDSVTNMDEMAEFLENIEVSENDSNADQDIENKKEDLVSEELDNKEEDPITWGKALGLDESTIVLDEEGNLKGVKVKVDGEEQSVDLKELVSGYQYNKYNTQKSQALAEEAKQFKEKIDLVGKSYAEKVDSLEKATAYVKSQFLKQYDDVNWSLIRQQNPAEYAALVQDYQMQSAEFDRILEIVSSTKTEELEKQKKEFKENQQQYFKKQIELTLQKNPEWNDPKALKNALEDLNSFIGEAYGFTPDEFSSINDHRMIEIIKDAMKFRRGIKEAEKKIVQQKPNFQKQTSSKRSNVSNLDKLIKRAVTSTGTQKRVAETDAIAQLLIDTGVKT